MLFGIVFNKFWEMIKFVNEVRLLIFLGSFFNLFLEIFKYSRFFRFFIFYINDIEKEIYV